MDLITRKFARENGLTYYFTGVACKRGHVSKRLSANSVCYECSFHHSAASDWKQPRTDALRARQASYNRDHRERTMLYRVRHRAKRDGVECTLSAADIIIPTHCPIFGIELTINTGGKIANPNSPSIDRKDPTRGYTPDNIWVISHRANMLKSNVTFDELLLMVEYLQSP